MNILSLDPMYSFLHNKIADACPGGKRISLLSSFGLSIYLPSFENKYFNKNILLKNSSVPDDVKEIVKNDRNHFIMKSIKSNELITDEKINYMAQFYLYLRTLLIEDSIDIVLLHNDLRWQHSLAIKLCKELGVKYLVTEQGLFRPNTTIVDKKGVNAFSSIAELNLNDIDDVNCSINMPIIKSSHNSLSSMILFFFYLILAKVGILLNTESKIVHNRHSIRSYLKRFYHLKLKRKITINNAINLSKKIIFVPLQLENDTQMIVHSSFSSNQKLINDIENAFYDSQMSKDYDLLFKSHPNDLNSYKFDKRTKISNFKVSDLLNFSVLVITINSSAALDVLETDIPLICLGDSQYNHSGISSYLDMSDISSVFNYELIVDIDTKNRQKFLNILKSRYSILGAGLSYDEIQIRRILKFINEDSELLEGLS